MCALVIGSESGVWILGDVFIRNYFIVLDYDKGEVTFIQEKTSSLSTYLKEH